MNLVSFRTIRLPQEYLARHLMRPMSRVCIVGSGPSGFYTAKYLLNDINVHVDVLEKLPVPYGNCVFVLNFF